MQLRPPTEPPLGGRVRDRGLGELIGRRAQLRHTLRALRGEPAATDRHGAVCGVTLTGTGGIGKPSRD